MTQSPADTRYFLFLRPSGLYSRLLFSATLERPTLVVSEPARFGAAYGGIRIPVPNMGARYLFCQWEEIVFSYGNHPEWDAQNHQQGRCFTQHEVSGWHAEARGVAPPYLHLPPTFRRDGAVAEYVAIPQELNLSNAFEHTPTAHLSTNFSPSLSINAISLIIVTT